ncbi:murein transglycosylase [Massilia arenosa]|uniref:peptidoglycan lytic exotransglycosylase n=1 Tax=Zemynaea arenosa TaxID=2561931 RepID=A0A4Y9SL89_9BURK|nr:murein transglycosylase A [Massilia arenosa]TFW24518.1 murein transglycosylase [Massilia arenosa]
MPIRYSMRRSVTVPLTAVAVLLAACTTQPVQQPAPERVKPPVVMPPPVQPVPVPPPVQPPVQPPVAEQPAPPPAPLFTAVSFAELPGWGTDDLREAWPAFLSSCSVLGKRSDWAEVCATARGVDGSDSVGIRNYFEANFVPQMVRSPDGSDTGLITGYYEAMLHGSRKRAGAFQTPLYKVPDDLLVVDLGSVYPQLKNMRLRGRVVGKKVVPYGSRAEIERSGLPGKELMWVNDPVEAFFLEVQGSGRVQLDDTGEMVRIGYADQNGHPYLAIGRWMVDQGLLPRDQVSAQSIKAWLAAHPERQQEVLNANPSYVFFRESPIPDPSVGPKGALGVPLTPARSVAIDQTLLPLGAPIFLATTQAGSDVPMQKLVMGQDTGGAIRGAVRADFFYGFGKDAEDKAGLMKQQGRLWVLLPRQMVTAAGGSK